MIKFFSTKLFQKLPLSLLDFFKETEREGGEKLLYLRLVYIGEVYCLIVPC
jgi:hypothetical protein